MFFLIRCVFWLGLVFCNIAGLNIVSPADLAVRAGGLAGSLASGLAKDGASAAQARINAVEAQCTAAPDKCLAHIDKLSRLAQAAGMGAVTPPVTIQHVHDTLLASDRAVAWRLPAPHKALELRPGLF